MIKASGKPKFRLEVEYNDDEIKKPQHYRIVCSLPQRVRSLAGIRSIFFIMLQL